MINILEKNAQIIAKLIHYIGLIIGIVASFFLFFILPIELHRLIRNIPFFDMILLLIFINIIVDFIPRYRIVLGYNITNFQSNSFLNTIACNRIIDFIKFYKY